MKRFNLPVPTLFITLLLFTCGGSAVCVAQPTQQVSDGSCDGLDLEQAGFSVRSFRIVDPFYFLPWVRARQQRAAGQIRALIVGKPFLYRDVRDGALKIIEEENFLPDASEPRVRIRVEFVSLQNCSNKSVDVVYRIYSSQIMPVLSGAPERRAEEPRKPEEAAGAENVDVPETKPWRLIPLAGYDSTQKLFGGGRLEIRQKRPSGLVNYGSFEGLGSSQMHLISANLKGSADNIGWLAHLDWSVDFNNFSTPTGAGKIKGGNLLAQIAGASRPLANGSFLFRFGGLVEGGHRQSDLVDPNLSSDTVANSPFGTIKLFVGVASRSRHNSFSGSYGLQLGAAGRAARIDWAKHIADVRHEFWYTFSNHRVLDLESRFNLGAINVRNTIPLGERFFGGNHEDAFVSTDSWQIRANPVIRAIPGKRFFRTAAGDGGDRFFSYNLTSAFSLWQRPLVPPELTNDDEFNKLLNAQLINAESFTELYFLTKDEHFARAAEFIKNPEANPVVQAALANMSSAVEAARTSHPGQHEAEFEACTDAISVAESRARNGAKAKGERLYGYVAALLSADEDLLNEVVKACVNTLNGSGVLNGDPAISSAGSRVDQIRTSMEGEFGQIDEAAAKKKAKDDMVFVRHTMETLLNDLNIYSVSPVFVFDAALLKSHNASAGGMRYGPGLGLRLELVNALSFTGGYAWNVRSGPGEGRGSFFFSMEVRDLLR
jgi:hypothetical protein